MKSVIKFTCVIVVLFLLSKVASGFVADASTYYNYKDKDGVEFKDLIAEPATYGKPGPGKIKVQITGAVKRPGIYYIPDDTSLTKLLDVTNCGVFKSSEHIVRTWLKSMEVTRVIDGKPRKLLIYMEAIAVKPELDMPALDGDRFNIKALVL